MEVQVSEDVQASIVTYKKSILPMYDIVVLWFTNNFIWKCPSSLIVNFYNKHITGNHLDVGVGTGYFLDKCRFPVSNPRVALMDVSRDSLAATAGRIQRYNPETHVANLLDPQDWSVGTFDSIGINYVLHCLPATIAEKEAVIARLATHLNDGGVLFGTTVLGKDIERNRAAVALMRFYNNKKLFTNVEDSPSAIEQIFARNFSKHHIHIHGCVAFFAGWK
jgi:SAM-dependent methyltransferase